MKRVMTSSKLGTSSDARTATKPKIPSIGDRIRAAGAAQANKKLAAEKNQKKPPLTMSERIRAAGAAQANKKPAATESVATEDAEMESVATIGLNTQDDSGNTPLHNAIIQGDKDAVYELYNQGADLLIENDDELTPAKLAEKRNTCKNIVARGRVSPRDVINHIPNANIISIFLRSVPQESGFLRPIYKNSENTIEEAVAHILSSEK